MRNEKMRQAYMPEPGKILYRDVPRPAVGPNCLLLKVERIGICGSDLHVYSGKHPLVSYPLVQGHEFSGYVQELGRDVTEFTVGDLVAVQPAVGCTSCDRCQAGLMAQCDRLTFIGGSLIGGGSDYFLVDSRQAITMPPGITPDEAALVEPVAVAVHAAGRAGDVRGADILVVGGGTIGNLVAQFCRASKAKRVVVSERFEFRRSILKSLGFEVLEPKEGPVFEREVMELLGARPCVAFECVGNAAALNGCLRTVVRGGTVIVLGVYEDPPKADMVLVQDKELTLIGSLMYTWDDYRRAVDLMEKGDINVRVLVTHHVPFDRWGEGYTLLLEHPDEVLKVIVDV
jgi:L-iditol 2-dehydrogenase